MQPEALRLVVVKFEKSSRSRPRALAFVYAKAKNVPAEKRGTFGVGNAWTWVAIDADSKLILSWLVGPRDAGSAYELVQDLAGRLRHRVQLTTDGNSCYIAAVEDTFGADIDYAILQKAYLLTAFLAPRLLPRRTILVRYPRELWGAEFPVHRPHFTHQCFRKLIRFWV